MKLSEPKELETRIQIRFDLLQWLIGSLNSRFSVKFECAPLDWLGTLKLRLNRFGERKFVLQLTTLILIFYERCCSKLNEKARATKSFESSESVQWKLKQPLQLYHPYSKVLARAGERKRG